jgi:hypothetical protein
MPRYALIDNCSGFIWGVVEAKDPVSAANAVDREVGVYHPRQYEEVLRPRYSNESGYLVYQAHDGLEVLDGSSPREIDEVSSLPSVCFVRFTYQED